MFLQIDAYRLTDFLLVQKCLCVSVSRGKSSIYFLLNIGYVVYVARCVLFFGRGDSFKLRGLMAHGRDQPGGEGGVGESTSNSYDRQQLEARESEALDQMESFCTTAKCRRTWLLDFLGEDFDVANCQGVGNIKKPLPPCIPPIPIMYPHSYHHHYHCRSPV